MSSLFPWRSVWLASAWCLVLVVIYLSLAPITPESDLEGGDKLAHAVAYAVLMLWFSQVYTATRTRAVTAVALAALGIALEYLQPLNGRSFEYPDMAADVIGVALGWLLAPPRLPNVLRRIESSTWMQEP